MRAAFDHDRPRRPWLPLVALASGLFTILLSLFMLQVFSRSPTIIPATGHNDVKPEHGMEMTTTTTRVDNFEPIPTPATTTVPLPDPAQETSFVLNPREHIAREPKTLRMTWNVTRETREPDGVEKLVYLINGRSTADLGP